MRIDKNTTIRLGDRNIVKIKKGDVVIWQKTTEPVEGPDYFYIENTYAGENTITFTTKKEYSFPSGTYSDKVEYSTDKRNWSIITFDTTTPQTVTISEGEKLYLRNDSGLFNYRSGNYKYITTINTTQKCKVGGNINTLLNYNEEIVDISGKEGCFTELFRNATNITDASNLVMPATTLAESCYYSMFSGCKSLVNAPSLPATTLATGCYQYMFSGCTSLTTAPALPATTLAYNCYISMFSSCTSLTTAPALPATELISYCYQYMFRGCSNLINPPELPATTLKRNCYEYMFDECKSLVTAPALPATTLAEDCYSHMFSYCPSLVNAPSLPATTLASRCYQSMFSNCKSLVNAPSLPATTLASSCYQSMFDGCSKLNSITVYAEDISASGCTDYWLNNVAMSGTFNNMGFATFETGESGIPNGWTENIPPIQSIIVNPDTFTIEFNNETVTCNSTLTITTTTGITNTRTNSATITVGENTGNTTRTLTETIPYKGSSYDVTIVQSAIQSITANPDTFTIEFNNETVTCNSTLTITTTSGTTATDTNTATLTVGENTGSTTRTITETIPYKGSSYDVTIVQSAIQSITANPDTFTIKSYKDTVKCTSTLTITTTSGTTATDTNTATITVGKNTGDTTRTLTETISYKGSSYQITIVQTANDHTSWNVESTGTYPFELNTNGYYESTNKGHDSSYSYATLNYSGFDELVLECINSGESNYDYGIISQPDVQLSESYEDDGATGSTKVFKSFKGESSTNPVQLTIPSDGESHFITIKFRKDGSSAQGNDSLQFKVIEP